MIAQAEQQPDLISTAQMPDCFFADGEGRESHGEFTGERLFAREPEKYRLVVSMLAERIGLIRIGRVLGLSPNTVRAVQEREGVAVDIEKKGLGAKAWQAAHLAIEGVIEDLSDPRTRHRIETRDMALIGAMMADKALLLNGEANVRLEVRISSPDHDDFNNYIERLRSVGTGLGEGKDGANAGVVEVQTPAPKALPEPKQES